MSDAYQSWNKYFLNGMVKAKLKTEKNQAIEIELSCVLENVV